MSTLTCPLPCVCLPCTKHAHTITPCPCILTLRLPTDEGRVLQHAAALLAAAQDAQLLDPAQDVDAMVELTTGLLAQTVAAQGIAAELKQLRVALQLPESGISNLDQACQEVCTRPLSSASARPAWPSASHLAVHISDQCAPVWSLERCAGLLPRAALEIDWSCGGCLCQLEQPARHPPQCAWHAAGYRALPTPCG